jgi:hypothetical protein
MANYFNITGGVQMNKIVFCLFILCTFFITNLHAQDTAEEYIVEKEDTLWDISDRKLEDAFLWPKLWNVNPHIENPDLIYPGTRVRIPSREELMSIPALPKKRMPFTRKQNVKKSEPRSVWKYAPIMKKSRIVDQRLFIASGWIADKFPSIGEIAYMPMNQRMASKNDIVYLELKDKDLTEKRFFVIRDAKTVTHPVSGKKIGHHVKIAGILEITGMDDNMTKAKITDSFEDVRLGDGLLPYEELEAPLIPKTARTPDMQGYIIESHMNSYLIGEGEILFIDRGENDGLKAGDVFTVLSEQPAQRPIGKIQIVSLQPSTAGAVLIQSAQEVTIGKKWVQKEN